ncbi:hypothetical protein SAMN04489798_3717 [Pseudomonas arsenicoxydans]|uniref:Uncharacterized protein n=1 Tax=Pseudomonas arsenicoxydans TaxID=702115 RepID=A0A1H0LZL3_9PSED|nr:hypothetical protein SAMN04489798_3717 [Pseudomonas arsenicoxydans]
MASTVVDLIEDHEHTIVIKKLPESFISMFHGLVGECRTRGTDPTVKAPAKYGSKG